MLSLLLASVFLLILERAEHRLNILWWTVPLTLLWANLHAGYALGLALMALFLAGGWLDAVLGFEPWSTATQRLRKLGWAVIACLAVVPLNPNGFRMYWYPFQTLGSRAMQAYIDEWASPNFHQAEHRALILLLIALVLVLPLSRRLRPRSLLLLAATMYLALRSVRHVPIFVLVAVPIFSALVEGVLQEQGLALRPGTSREPRLTWKMLLNAALLVAVAAFTVSRLQTVIQSQAETERRAFPAAAAAFVVRERLPGPILNHYNWGGYLIWRLYPQYRVYADGRADLYGDAFMDERAAIYSLTDPTWRAALARWGIRTVILPSEAPLTTALRHQPAWQQRFQDSQAIVLTEAGTK
jgi:hypothetical protein